MRNCILLVVSAVFCIALLSCDYQKKIKKEESFVITGTTSFTKIKVVDVTPGDYAPEADVTFTKVAMNDGVALAGDINVAVVKEAFTQAKINAITYTHGQQGDTYVVQYSVPRVSATDADKIYITFGVVSEKDIIIDMQNGDAMISYEDNGNAVMDTYTSSVELLNGNIDIAYRGQAGIEGLFKTGNGNITLNVDKTPSSNIRGRINFSQINGTTTVDGIMYTPDFINIGTGIPTTVLDVEMMNGNIVINYIR